MSAASLSSVYDMDSTPMTSQQYGYLGKTHTMTPVDMPSQKASFLELKVIDSCQERDVGHFSFSL